jgi:flagellar biosynthesis protein FlhG
MSRIITVASGKGGVGKTNVSVNMALFLADQGYRTCLFDADMGLANVDILLGIYPEYTLEDVLLGEKQMNEIIIRTESGLDIIPGSSGVKMLADPDPEQVDYLIKSLSEIENYDFFIFDTSAGISRSVISFCMTSPEIVLVVTPEPTSLTDAYALLKILCLNKFDSKVMVAINQCMDMKAANKLYVKFKEVVQKYLEKEVCPLGAIPLDSHVSRAVKEQKPLVTIYPNSDAAKGIKNISRYLASNGFTETTDFNLNDFWAVYIETLNSDLKMAYNKKKTQSSSKNPPTEHNNKPGEAVNQIEGSGIVEHPAPQVKSDVLSMKNDQMGTKDIFKILEGLAEGISTISSELGAIRKIMEGGDSRFIDKTLHSEDSNSVV